SKIGQGLRGGTEEERLDLQDRRISPWQRLQTDPLWATTNSGHTNEHGDESENVLWQCRLYLTGSEMKRLLRALYRARTCKPIPVAGESLPRIVLHGHL